MKRILLLALIVVATTPTTHALRIDPAPDPGVGGGASSRRLSPADFKLNMVVTQASGDLDRWLATEPDGNRRSRPREFRANQKGSVHLVLTGFKIAQFEAMGLTAEVQLYGPDGKLLWRHPDLARSAWGRPKQGYLALVPEVTFAFDQADRAGVYTYRATVTDTNRTTIARAEEKIIFLN